MVRILIKFFFYFLLKLLLVFIQSTDNAETAKDFISDTESKSVHG